MSEQGSAQNTETPEQSSVQDPSRSPARGSIRTWLNEAFTQLQACAHRWWYTPMMGVIAFLTVFLALIPTEVLVVKTVLLRRGKGWVFTALAIALFSAAASFVLAALVSTFGDALMTSIFGPGVYESSHWVVARDWIDRYGGIGMALIALSPIPMQPGVAICALGGMPPLEVAFYVWMGRSLKFGVFAFAAAKTPKAFMKKSAG
jgi:hypothetical protein